MSIEFGNFSEGKCVKQKTVNHIFDSVVTNKIIFGMKNTYLFHTGLQRLIYVCHFDDPVTV